MNLRFFRSLLSAEKSLPARIGAVASASCNFDGVAINHVSHYDNYESSFDTALHTCDKHSLRVIFELKAINADEVGRLLDILAKSLSGSPNMPDLVVFHAPTHLHGDVDKALGYLRDVLPLTAQFMESHPAIGSMYGRLNAHGNALNDHVVGVCHHLPHFEVPELAELLDVYLPTRLALSGHHNISGHATPCEFTEDVVQNTDILFIDECEPKIASLLWNKVWRTQRRDGAKETYVVVPEQETNQLMVERIRKNFLKSR